MRKKASRVVIFPARSPRSRWIRWRQHNPLYFVLPSYSDLNLVMQVATGSLVTAKDVFFLSVYAADFVIIMLLLAFWRFRSKELV